MELENKKEEMEEVTEAAEVAEEADEYVGNAAEVEVYGEDDAELDEEDAKAEKAMQSFLSGSEGEPEEVKKPFVTKKEFILCAMTVFALALWNLSGYGAIILAGIALCTGLIINVGKNAMRVMVSNSLTLGAVTALRVGIAVIFMIYKTAYFYIKGYNVSGTVTNFETVLYNIISVAAFVLFVINACMLIMKKRSVIFNKTAENFVENEEE